MKRKDIGFSVIVAAVSLAVCGCISGRKAADGREAVSLLVPVPRSVEFKNGFADPLTAVKVVAGGIAEAPSHLRDQAYRLDISPECRLWPAVVLRLLCPLPTHKPVMCVSIVQVTRCLL